MDEPGLVHGGFVFGLADHAAMLAVNHPNVVLGGADVKFLKPVRVGEALVAEAVVTESVKNRHMVDVTVTCEKRPVFKGQFCLFCTGSPCIEKFDPRFDAYLFFSLGPVIQRRY